MLPQGEAAVPSLELIMTIFMGFSFFILCQYRCYIFVIVSFIVATNHTIWIEKLLSVKVIWRHQRWLLGFTALDLIFQIIQEYLFEIFSISILLLPCKDGLNVVRPCCVFFFTLLGSL